MRREEKKKDEEGRRKVKRMSNLTANEQRETRRAG